MCFHVQDFFDKLMIDGDLRLERFKALAKVHGIPQADCMAQLAKKKVGNAQVEPLTRTMQHYFFGNVNLWRLLAPSPLWMLVLANPK